MEQPVFFKKQSSKGFRTVDRLTVHRGPRDFSELIGEVIPEDAKYIVFDLDRTFHLERNVGEFFGWDLVAREAWGASFHALAAGQARPDRFVYDPNDLVGIIRYLAIGARAWALPGLFYGLWMKLVYSNPRLRRFAFYYFGPEPVRAVQQVPQGALLHQMSRFPLNDLRTWAYALFHRLADDMTITPQHIAEIRKRCPDATILISSASPQPVLEAAQRYFGVDDVIFSEIETVDELMSTPPWLDWFFDRPSAPRRVAPLASLRINNSHAKVEKLLLRYPDFADSVAVGISDTDKGEDHAWNAAFEHLVDVNSTEPFPPLVPAHSPTKTIDSVSISSRYEQRMSSGGQRPFLDPRRKNEVATETRNYTGEELDVPLREFRRRADRLQREGYTIRERLQDAAELAWGEVSASMDAFNAALDSYNEDDASPEADAFEALRSAWSTFRGAQRRLNRIQRPFADKYRALGTTLREARAAFGPDSGASQRVGSGV